MKVPNATEVEVFRLRQRNKELNEQVKALQELTRALTQDLGSAQTRIKDLESIAANALLETEKPKATARKSPSKKTKETTSKSTKG